MGEEGGQPGQITHPCSRQLAGCEGVSALQTQSVSHLPTLAIDTPETGYDIRRHGEGVIRGLLLAFFMWAQERWVWSKDKERLKKVSVFFLSQMASYLTLMQRELFKALVISHIVRVREKMWIFTLRKQDETSAHHTEHSLSVSQAEAPLYAMELKTTGEKCSLPLMTAHVHVYPFLFHPTDKTLRHDSKWDNAMNISPCLIYCNPTLYRTYNIRHQIINVGSKLHKSFASILY